MFINEIINHSLIEKIIEMNRYLSLYKFFYRIKRKNFELINKFLNLNEEKSSIIIKNDIYDKILRFFISDNIIFNQIDNLYF